MPSDNWLWLKLYAEARTDKKLAKLSDAEFRVWFNLLCYSSEQEQRGVILCDDIEHLALECSNDDVDLLWGTLEKLQKLKIVCVEGEGSDMTITFVNWSKRQKRETYPSDAPDKVLARVQKHRQNLRQAAVNNDCVDPSTIHESSAVTACNDTCNDCNESCNECNESVTGVTDREEKRRIESNPPPPPHGGVDEDLELSRPNDEVGLPSAALKFKADYPDTLHTTSDIELLRAWRRTCKNSNDELSIMRGLNAWKQCQQWRDPNLVPSMKSFLINQKYTVPPKTVEPRQHNVDPATGTDKEILRLMARQQQMEARRKQAEVRH